MQLVGWLLTGVWMVLLFPHGVTAQSADASAPTQEAIVASGRALFAENCAICHGIDEKIVGPPLRDVHERQPVEWIVRFVRNSQKVIQSGDEYAVKLYEAYGKTQMTAFDFSDEEILSIIAYIKAESAKEVAVAQQDNTAPRDSSAKDPPTLHTSLIIGGILLLLVLLLVILSVVVTLLRKHVAQDKTLSPQDKEEALHRIHWGRFFSSYGFVGVAVFLLVAIVLKVTVDGLYTVGVQEGYQPTQPIAFSHKLHAGVYEIDCNYCHTGVRKSKNANIPSANICMNCHNEIKKDAPEIQKIHHAVASNTPIEWIRVHNLPDLAYFSHVQHVAVGKVDCQTCHGPVEEMEVVRQHANLTMGWCVDCHKQTPVQTRDNEYYDRLLQFHRDQGIKAAMKVEDIGGLECAKCHY